jgi:hypothetical protein
MRKSSLIILITLAFSCVSALGFYIRPVGAIIWIGGHITSDTTWMPVDTYRVINDTYVDPGATLTILPGVHVQIADGFSLIVQGNLNATGTDASPIVFTSSRVSPIAGAWNTIDFKGASNCSFTLEHVRVEFAVNGITVESPGSAIVARSEFFNCSESGIMINGISNLAIEENTIGYNKNGIATDPDTHQGIVIDRNVISSNRQNGVYLKSSSSSSSYSSIYNVTFSSNTISSNTQNGIYIDSSIYSNIWYSYSSIYNLTFFSNTISSNTQNGIYLDSYSNYWGDSNSSIYNVAFSSNTISSNGQNGIGLYSYSTAYIAPIYNVTFSSNTISSNGQNGIGLYSYGSSIHDVTFSSTTILSNIQDGIYFDSRGYPIYGTTFSSNTISSNIQNGIELHGNHMPSVAYDLAASNNSVASNKKNGLYFVGIRSNVTENSISYNRYGIFYESTTGNLANRNDIYFNTFGMNVTGEATVNAEYDYWGDSTGPYQPSINPDGKGNPVNGNGVDLDFIPFLTSPQGHINQRPVAVLSVDKNNVGVGETVSFNGTTSTDDGRIDYYFFDFGDGTNSSWTTLPVVTHKYTQQKTYNATLMVMDDFGVTSNNAQQAVMQVIVVPEFPSVLVLPLFMIATLLAVIAYRKKRISTK